jgi:hypothetical protein
MDIIGYPLRTRGCGKYPVGKGLGKVASNATASYADRHRGSYISARLLILAPSMTNSLPPEASASVPGEKE